MTRRGAAAGNHGQGSNWIRREKRLRIYARDGWRCVWCLSKVIDGKALRERLAANPLDSETRKLRIASLDHFLARGRGGTNEAGNLLTCCMQCNEERGDLPALLWARKRADSAPEHAREQVTATILEYALDALGAPLLSLEERSAA